MLPGYCHNNLTGNNASETGRYSSDTPTCSTFKSQRKKEANKIPSLPHSLMGTNCIGDVTN